MEQGDCIVLRLKADCHESVSQCSALCILLVNSWPPAKLQLNVTEQGLFLIKCLALDCNCSALHASSVVPVLAVC